MNLTDETKDGVVVLSPAGRIDTRTSGEFERAVMARAAGPDAATRVVMNFASLDYINSTGMRVLLILAKRLAAARGKLVLCEMKEHILEVFKISGFNQILTITDTEAGALDRFRAGAGS